MVLVACERLISVVDQSAFLFDELIIENIIKHRFRTKVLILPVELNPSTASLADFYPAKVETLTQHALALLVRFEAMLEG